MLKYGSVAGKDIMLGVAGATFSILVDTDGGIHTWGQNDFGQLGSNAALTYLPTPVPLVSRALAGRKILQVATGAAHTVVLADDGYLYSTGSNANGQLGLGNITQYSSPKQVGALTTWSKVAMGYGFTLALKAP
jgi:alpha-tubulin suppressor-like RCC1 family protein